MDLHCIKMLILVLLNLRPPEITSFIFIQCMFSRFYIPYLLIAIFYKLNNDELYLSEFGLP